MKRTYQRGEMYYADLGRGVGSEQEGRRPVVFIQNDIGKKHSPTVIVAAITTKTAGKRKLPTHYEIGTEHGMKVCMNMEEYVQALEIHVASRKLILGDGESVLFFYLADLKVIEFYIVHHT